MKIFLFDSCITQKGSVHETLFCAFPSTSGRVVSHQVCALFADVWIIHAWRMTRFMDVVKKYSAMTKWPCSTFSERI